MGLIDDVLKHYATGSGRVPENINEHFDQVAQAAPKSSIADGLAAAFRSDQTPAFGNMVSSLFGQSSGEQKAGMLNQLLPALGPGVLSQVAGGGALAGLLGGGNKSITPEQAQQISPDLVRQLATHAEKSDPSIVDKTSTFYAQHPTLVKTLGGTVLSIALAKVAQRRAA